LGNAALHGKRIDPDTVRRDDCCVLGKWLHGPGGQRWGHKSAFTQQVPDHKTFHLEAGKLADKINRGQLDARDRCSARGIEGKVAAVAAVDRLVHHATILEMNVDSYRRRAALPASRQRSKPKQP
jgi:aerotaxis receptor